MRVLFISYYFDPLPGVGGKRISYWARNIHKYEIDADVITSIPQTEKISFVNVYSLPNTRKKNIFSFFIKDAGLSWKKDLLTFFKNKDDLPEYNAIIITGGPFLHMGTIRYLKVRFKCPVLLDFRDPFGINPRFRELKIKTIIKKRLEAQFIKYADKIITVNRFCAELLQSGSKAVHIIENGYDEAVLDQTKRKPRPADQNQKFIIAHAGSLYEDRDPKPLLNVIMKKFPDHIIFKQYGTYSAHFEEFKDKVFFCYEGEKPYKEVLEYLNDADACFLATKGEPFESTTKIYDYLALNKKILILTNGQIKSGHLFDITRDYPNVLWASNHKPDEINSMLNQLLVMPLKKYDPKKHSRAASLKKLVELLR